MARQMSIARQIRVQKLQNKNRMVGQTFNPSGITSKQIAERESKFITELKAKTLEERKELWNNIKAITENINHSWHWEWCAFKRHFVFNGECY